MVKKRWQILLILATIHFTNIVDSMIIMPMGDIFIGLYEITTAQYSLLVSSYAIAAFLSSIIGMFFLDYFERKKALIFIYSGFIIGTFICAFSYSYYLMLASRFVAGCFGGILGALILAIVTDLYPFKERGQAIGVIFSAFSAASALGVPTGIYLATKFNWQAPFLIISSLALVLIIIAVIIFPQLPNKAVAKKPLESLRSIYRDSNQVNALISGFMVVLAHFLIIPFITPYMIRNVGFSQEQIALIFLCGGIATIFSAPLIGKLVDKFGVMRLFVGLMLLSFIPTIAITHMGAQPVYFALIFTTLFFIFGSGRMIPPNTIITAAVGPETRGSFMSMKSAFSQLSIASASAISGFMVSFNEEDQLINYEYVAYLAMIMGIIALFLTSKIYVAKGN